jgi:hypothetical protein
MLFPTAVGLTLHSALAECTGSKSEISFLIDTVTKKEFDRIGLNPNAVKLKIVFVIILSVFID